MNNQTYEQLDIAQKALTEIIKMLMPLNPELRDGIISTVNVFFQVKK